MGDNIFCLSLDTGEQSGNASAIHSYHLYKMTFPKEHNKKVELPLSKQNGIWVEKFLPLDNRSQLNVKSVGQLHRRPATTILS